jgi:hypothetical protein
MIFVDFYAILSPLLCIEVGVSLILNSLLNLKLEYFSVYIYSPPFAFDRLLA